MSPLHSIFMQICYGLLSQFIIAVRRDQFQESYEQQWRMGEWLWKHPASHNFFSGESAMSISSLNSPFLLIRTFSRVTKWFISCCLCNRNKIWWGNRTSIFLHYFCAFESQLETHICVLVNMPRTLYSVWPKCLYLELWGDG